MPGSSLWLLPPDGHPLYSILTALISQTSVHFSSPHLFLPHITLTSNIPPSAHSPNPQQWLDNLQLPAATAVKARFEKLNSEDVFFRKLYIQVRKDGMADIAIATRGTVEGYQDEDVVQKWVNLEYMPHLSLLYYDCPKVSDAEQVSIGKLVKDAGVSLEGEGELGGWTGGRVVLVPTDKPIKDWVPIAERKL